MNYQLIIKIPFEAMDDLEARQVSQALLRDLNAGIAKDFVEKKLQKVFRDKPPEKVDLKLNITPQ